MLFYSYWSFAAQPEFFSQSSLPLSRVYDGLFKSTLSLLGFYSASLGSTRYCCEGWHFKGIRHIGLFHTDFLLSQSTSLHIRIPTYDRGRLPSRYKDVNALLLQSKSKRPITLHRTNCTFGFVVKRQGKFVLACRLKYLCRVDMIVELCDAWFGLSKLLSFHVVQERLLIQSFPKVDVGGLKIELCLGANEELGLEVRGIEDFVQNNRIFRIDSHFLRPLQYFGNIWLFNLFLRLGFEP